jgi:hypothetical protein
MPRHQDQRAHDGDLGENHPQQRRPNQPAHAANLDLAAEAENPAC